MTITPAAITYKDAASCYDRLVEPFTNLALRAIGCPATHLTLHSAVHQTMKYHIKTPNGVASQHSGHTPPTKPFWGAGQGACDAAARCTAVSSCIFYAYQQKCQPLYLINPTQTRHTKHTLLAFVDDATTIIPLPTNHIIPKITSTVTDHISTWEQLQHSAGGKVNIDKCNVGYLLWHFDRYGLPRLTNLENIPVTITIIGSQTNKPQQIPPIDIHDAYKYLGVHQCINGDYAPQAAALLKKSHKYAKALRACPLTRTEALVAYFTCYLPSITYALPACTIPAETLYNIDSPVILAVLSKMGFNRKLPPEVVYSPQHFGGIGLRDLYCKQVC